MILISFSGLDGSGKTAQINGLIRYLKKNRLSYKRIHTIQCSIANKIMGGIKKIEDQNSKSRTSAGIIGIMARKITLLIDVLLFRLSLLTMGRVDVIIADRYFYDSLINIYFLEKNRDPHVPPFLLHLIRRPELPIYLCVNPKTARERKNDQGTAYLEAKYDLFEKLKKRIGFIEIKDGAVEEVGNQVASLVERKLLSRKQ